MLHCILIKQRQFVVHLPNLASADTFISKPPSRRLLMGYFLYTRSRLTVVIFLLVVVGVFAACAPNPQAQLISPDMVPEGAGGEFVRPTPTPIPNIADLSEDQIVAGLPEEALAAFPGDPDAGQQLATLNGCVGCHNLDPNNVVVAPTWNNVANTAIIRNPGAEGPAAYLYHSIVAPNDYIVPGYNGGIMPQTYSDTLTAEQIVDIVAYLLTLRGEPQ
jgi:mono/diheme cytochrome c family protein